MLIWCTVEHSCIQRSFLSNSLQRNYNILNYGGYFTSSFFVLFCLRIYQVYELAGMNFGLTFLVNLVKFIIYKGQGRRMVVFGPVKSKNVTEWKNPISCYICNL